MSEVSQRNEGGLRGDQARETRRVWQDVMNPDRRTYTWSSLTRSKASVQDTFSARQAVLVALVALLARAVCCTVRAMPGIHARAVLYKREFMAMDAEKK